MDNTMVYYQTKFQTTDAYPGGQKIRDLSGILAPVTISVSP